MAGGVRVVQPAPLPGELTPEIDTVRVVVDGETRERERITVAPNPARVSWGEALDLVAGQTAELVSFPGELNLLLQGFTATGTGDGLFRLMVDGLVVQSGRINRNSPVLSLTIPVGYTLPAGAEATVTVTADGVGLNQYEATVYGEVTSGG